MEAEHKMARRIQLRRDTATAWAAANPVLSQGEIGLDLTSKKIKIGDGTTLWNALAYWDDKETDLAGYATELYVDNAIGAITIPTYISQFGEGFSLTAADKIVTNKLYSTNLTQPNQHYRLEVDTNGVVVLPDSSIINGSTIRGVAGTGELNYTGITIGPNSNDAEKTWMWVDHANAYISTNNSANTWTFGNNGTLNSPGGSFTKTTNNFLATNVATQVVWTSTQNDISGVKLTIQVECDETGGVNYPNWETQVCEAIIAVRGYNSVSEPVMSVYGVTHTSVAPLMTFSVQRNPTTFLIEIVGTRTATASPLGGAYLRIYSVETGTND